MDNASVHMLPEVKEEMHACSAFLMHTAPYSPDVNPIEKMTSVCKTMLKSNEKLDWMRRHDLGLSSVTPLISRRFYKTCRMPLCGVMVEDDDENNILIGLCATIVFSNIDDLI